MASSRVTELDSGTRPFDLSNYQLQLEEAVALQSIYQDDFRCISAQGLPEDVELEPESLLMSHFTPEAPVHLVIEILVHVELPQGGVQLRIPLRDVEGQPTSPAPGGANEEHDSEVTSVAAGEPVTCLPPLRLLLSLPYGYPSSEAPVPHIHALWLTRIQASTLANTLIQQWEEEGQQGGPACYLWVEWLKQSTLQHLGVTSSLVVRQYKLTTQQDEGCTEAGSAPGPSAESSASLTSGQEGVPCDQQADEVAIKLLRYAASLNQTIFNQSTWRCPICFEDILGSRCIKLPDCKHVFCSSCISVYCQALAAEGAVENIKCPEPTCRLPLSPHVLQSVLSKEDFIRWETLMLQKALDRMSDICYCPRCQATCVEDKDHMGECPTCFFVFCSACTCAWHPGEPCISASEVFELHKKRDANRKLTAVERARREVDLANQVKSMKLVQQTTKECPCCSSAIDKFEGCNKVTCGYCSTIFCWRCKQVISDYSHFSAETCVLFNDEEVQRWNNMFAAPRAMQVENRRMEVNMLLERRHAQARPAHCPMCGQLNVKLGGNNNIRCWSCNNNFCGVCRVALKGKPGLHFGPSGCKQHTFD